ncbi:hypothetical protein, partial [Kitasatospora indigofera]|uniref:hypothetical protein n=1 Tax=Kitasatospora indigofera TaxID=67307 RepID=UPI00167EE5E2
MAPGILSDPYGVPGPCSSRHRIVHLDGEAGHTHRFKLAPKGQGWFTATVAVTYNAYLKLYIGEPQAVD